MMKHASIRTDSFGDSQREMLRPQYEARRVFAGSASESVGLNRRRHSDPCREDRLDPHQDAGSIRIRMQAACLRCCFWKLRCGTNRQAIPRWPTGHPGRPGSQRTSHQDTRGFDALESGASKADNPGKPLGSGIGKNYATTHDQ
jgi:hypothetical protein